MSAFKDDIKVEAEGLQTNAGFVGSYTTISGNYTVQEDDYVVGVDTSGEGSLITLPDLTTLNPGSVFAIKDIGGNAENNNITVSGVSSQTIDGSTTDVVDTNYLSSSYMTTGSEWIIL